MLTIVEVRTEYRLTPMGIDNAHPRFFWRLDSDQDDVRQTRYRLRVSLDSAATKMVWDSDEKSSDASIHVPYEGPALKARKRYWVTVEVHDNHGQTAVSEPTWFETGMGSAKAWQGVWITPDPISGKGSSSAAPLMRRTFVLNAVPTAARIFVTALGLYALYVNGHRVSDHLFTPGWTSYDTRLQYQVYDVGAWLHSGSNVIAVMLGNGWYAGELGWSGNRSTDSIRRGLLLELHDIDHPSESPLVVSDEQWRYHAGPIEFSEIYHGEIYDANHEVAGWAEPGLNDATWSVVDRLGHGTHMIVAQENLPTRVTQEVAPVAMLTTPKGEIVVDFGQNLTGRVRMTWPDLPQGASITLRHAEVLDASGNFYTENLRKARQTVRYTANGQGAGTFSPEFTFQGFRYVALHTEPHDLVFQLPWLSMLTAEVIHTDLDQTMAFSSSDPLVNRLQENVVWGQRGNFLDVPTDCPQRDERLGWTGDAQVFVGTAAFNMLVAPFFSKWLKDLASDQLPSGAVPHVVPNVLGPKAFASAAWADAAVICPWTLYTHYGDRQLLAVQYPSMRAWVEYMRQSGSRMETFDTGFHFGDWLGLDSKPGSYVGATAIDFISNAFYAHSTELLAKAARVLGRSAEHAQYEDLYQRIREAFRDEFVTPTGRLAVPTQTGYVLALAFDLLEAAHRPRAFAALTQLIEQNDGHLTTGFVGTPYLLPVLSRFGSMDQAYQLLLKTDYPSWLYPVTKGATTIWEHWDGIKPDGSFWSPDMNSFNHYAYGAVGEWLYTVVAGIQPREDHPGFQTLWIRPKPGPGLDWVTAEYQSLYGPIRSAWRITDQRFSLEVSVPPNTRATVEFPHAHFTQFETDAPGVLHAETDVPWMDIGSGRYHFAYQMGST